MSVDIYQQYIPLTCFAERSSKDQMTERASNWPQKWLEGARTRRAPTRGRDSELEALHAGVTNLARGEGGWLVISGPPGSGKSRLLEELQPIAESLGVRYFYGTGDSEGHLTPFAPLVNGMASGGVDLFSEDEDVNERSSPENRFWALQELQDAFDHASMQGPMVIVVDDLQWCDDATLLALRTLPRRLLASPILWVVAVRQSALRSSKITEVFERYDGIETRMLSLRALEDEAVSQMATDMLGASPDPQMLTSILASEGLPLYVLELLSGLADEGLIEIDGGLARLLGPTVPQRFRESVRARASLLSEQGRRMLEVAAVVGRRFSIEVLADMLGVVEGELIQPIREAMDAGLISETGDDLQFSHELFREIIEDGVPSGVHRLLQRKAIDVQLSRGSNVVEVATMLADSAQPGDSEAVLLLRSAAIQLSSMTPSTAADLALRALQLVGATDATRADTVTEAATYLWQAGQATRARKLVDDELAQTSSSEQEAQLRIGIIRMSGQFSFADAVAHTNIALALPGLSASTREKLEAQLAYNSLMTGEVANALATSLGQTDDLASLASFTTAKASNQFYGGHWDEAFTLMHEALAIADRAGIRFSSFTKEEIFISFMLVSSGDITGALREADRGIRETTRLRQGGSMRLWVMTRSRVLLDAGRLADAAVEAQALLEMVDELGPGNFADITAIYTLARVALFEGDEEAIAKYQIEAERMMRDPAQRIKNLGQWIATLNAMWRGKYEEAIEIAAPVLDRLSVASPYFVGSTDAADDVIFVRLALRAGRRSEALTMVEFGENRARENPSFAILRAASLHARALLTDEKSSLEKAIVLFESIDRPIVLASAVEDLGRIVSQSDPADAIEHFKRARDLYGHAGAFHDEKRVALRLANLGDTSAAVDAGTGPTPWGGLSSAQRSVVELIVQGMTNRQVAEKLYLSPHTVNAHLRYAFAKLSVHSRVELAGLYHQMHASGS